MSHDTLKATLLQLALPAVRAQGLDIWGLELIEGRQMIVRLFVEAATGNTETDMMNGAGGGAEEEAPSREQLSATVDQCEAISRQFSLALDAEDVIDRAYTLEVSTPGFNRIFFSAGQMSAYVGDLIEARMPAPFAPAPSLPARRTWKGTLLSVTDDTFVLAPSTIDADGDIHPEELEPVHIPFAATRRVSRIYVFRRPAKPGKGPKKTKTAPLA